MASPSGPGQPSGPDPGSVLRDNCKKSVLEPSQNTENVPLYERMRQVMNEWELSPRMWPVGYIIGSPYSPFRVEQELPNRNWRNAFEDLLALESGDEMVSHESRKQEKAVAARVNWERANHCIGKLSQYNAREAPGFNLAQTILNELKSSEHETDPALSSWLMKKIDIVKELAQRRVALAQTFKDREETRREWSASRHKDRGQWMASLITSGALRGWRSTLEDSEDGDVIHLTKDLVAPEDQDGISLSERELHDHFEDGKPFEQGLPGPPWYQVSHPSHSRECLSTASAR